MYWYPPGSPDAAEFRSFRIVDGAVTEEEVRIVPDAVAAAGAAGGAGAGPGGTARPAAE